MSLTSSLTVRVCESQRLRLENADCTGGGAYVNNLSQKEDGQCRQDGLGLASCAPGACLKRSLWSSFGSSSDGVVVRSPQYSFKDVFRLHAAASPSSVQLCFTAHDRAGGFLEVMWDVMTNDWIRAHCHVVRVTVH